MVGSIVCLVLLQNSKLSYRIGDDPEKHLHLLLVSALFTGSYWFRGAFFGLLVDQTQHADMPGLPWAVKRFKEGVDHL